MDERKHLDMEKTASGSLRALEARVASVIKGKPEAIRLAICTLLAKGHLLIEDVPGVGKTTLAFTLARAISGSFHRVQFTSDLLPSDIVGLNIFNPEKHDFEFKKGPIFANIVLADEINRTSPKTQSALLEAMNEGRVTLDGKTYTLPEPFMVIATQNSLEYRGTFPLPESQLDRFMLHLKLGYPSREHEREALLDEADFEAIERMRAVVSASEVLRMQTEAESVRVDDSVLDYLLQIVAETRRDDRIRLGASTRGAQFLLRGAKANAYYEGRDFIVPDDVKTMAPYVLGHRIILNRQTYISDAVRIIRQILERLPVPV
jgi:MoxR-like ATPase